MVSWRRVKEVGGCNWRMKRLSMKFHNAGTELLTNPFKVTQKTLENMSQ